MITITHTPTEGTLIGGSQRGDGVYELLRGTRDGWRWMPSIRRIGINGSRDRNANMYKIKRAADELRRAGYEVDVAVDESDRRSVAEIEAGRAERAEARAEGLSAASERTQTAAMADYSRAHQMADQIPFGQPMMPDHYSYGRDRRYRDRIHTTYGRAFEGMDRAEELGRRAGAAEAGQRHRESVPATLRRIKKLEADARRYRRDLAGRVEYVPDGEGGYKLTLVKPGEKYRARLEAALAEVTEKLDYWQGQVKAAEAEGTKVWSRADFTKGDYVQHRWGWAEVTRVNPKSVTIPWGANAVHLDVVTRDNVKDAMGGSGWTETVTYDEVKGRMSAAEMAAKLAEGSKS